MSEMRFEAAGAVTDWADFDARLTAYLAMMESEEDHLIVELPETGDVGTTPYAQFAVGPGRVLRAEISGNPVLAPAYHLTDDQLFTLHEDCGWQLPLGEHQCPNLVILLDGKDAPEILAGLVREVLEDFFGIPHPTLMSFRAWGPAADGSDKLGLTRCRELELVLQGDAAVIFASGPDELMTPVSLALQEFLDDVPSLDDDGDFHLACDATDVYVRVRKDQPSIDVLARVVYNVRSRRQAAIEANLLNRDQIWTKYVLVDRTVFQVMRLPAHPFVPAQLTGLMPVYFESLRGVRGDLAVRTGGRAA